MKILVRISDRIDAVLRPVCAVLLIGFVVVMFAQVVLRNLFPAHILPWADGVCRYFFIWASFAGISLATKRRSQITVNVIVRLFRGKARIVADWIMIVLTVFVACLLVYWGLRAVKMSIPIVADTVNMSAAWLYASVPVGMVILIYQTIICAFEDHFSKVAPEIEVEEIE